MTSTSQDYVLGHGAAAARRLEIQDAQFAEVSERLLDDINLRPDDRVVEFGVGAGGFSRRILRRLGKDGVLVGVDYTTGLLEQAQQNITGCGAGRFEPVVADVSQPGPWLDGADVVVGRAVLHHIPMAEGCLGRLRAALRPGTRIGFIEPEFRAFLGRIAVLQAAGRQNLDVLRRWAEGIVRFYHASGLSPEIGATLGWALEGAGYRDVRRHLDEGPTDEILIENLLMYCDEIRDKYAALGIMSPAEMDEHKRQLQSLSLGGLPSVWGMHRVMAVA
jgi:ubiquinone/menaquinone biosynthesis C-methylase UbiE